MAFERHGFQDELNIDTPEQVELRYNVAGIGSRFVAVLLDHLIQFAVVILQFLLIFWIASSAPKGGNDDLDTAGKWFIAIWIFANFLLFWGYFSLFEAYWNGQTPGKRVMKLRVIKDSGRQITFFEALARNLLRFVDYFPGFYLVGLITMLCNKSNKRLGDFVGGTIVVHERLEEQPMLMQQGSMFSTPAAAEPWRDPVVASMFAADSVAKLAPADLVVIEAFFARALDLTLEVRAAMAYRLIQQMSAKMGAVVPEGNPERALESIAYEMRGSGRR